MNLEQNNSKSTNTELSTEPANCGYTVLGAVLFDVSKKGYQVEIKTGTRDTVNGYGWHMIYWVKAFKTIDFCLKCRKKTGLDYSDNAHVFSNHKHEYELKMVLNSEYLFEKDVCDALLSNCT
jgi:hypothetical protein